MMARTLSRAACCRSISDTAGRACLSALVLILSPTAFSIAPQLPSRAETISPLAAIGQLGFFQLAPRAFFCTSDLLSARPEKKLAHSPVTDEGLSSYRA